MTIVDNILNATVNNLLLDEPLGIDFSRIDDHTHADGSD